MSGIAGRRRAAIDASGRTIDRCDSQILFVLSHPWDGGGILLIEAIGLSVVCRCAGVLPASC